MTAILAFFKLVPAWVWLALALVSAGLFYGHTRYNAGQESTQVKWDASIKRGEAEVTRLKSEAGKITVKTETVYVDRIKTIREKGDEVVRKVPVYIPSDSPDLSGGWRLFHAAAVGEGPLPDPTGAADAAPVPAQVFAITLAENYTTYQETAARLTGLQSWVKEQCKLNPPESGCGK